MGTEAVKSSLDLDLGTLRAAFADLGQHIQAQEAARSVAAARVSKLIERVNATKTELAILERMGSKFERKFVSSRGMRQALGLAAGTAISELGLPETVQPLVNIGTAALSGAAFGGLPGAFASGTLTAVMELVRAFQAHRAEMEKLKAEVLQRQHQLQIFLERQAAEVQEREEKLSWQIGRARAEGAKQAYDLINETARLVAAGEQ